MLAANAALASGGMTHCFCRCGLSSVFFSVATDRVIAGALDDVQFHDSLLQQLQRPPLATLRRCGTGQGDQFRLRGPVKDARSGRGWRMLADQHGLEPFFHQLLASSGHRVGAGIEGRCNLAVTPPSPASEASAFNRMRALVSSRAGCLPICVSASSRSRSSSLSFTMYLFTAICFAVTMHLRHCGAIDSEIHRKSMTRGTSSTASSCRS